MYVLRASALLFTQLKLQKQESSSLQFFNLIFPFVSSSSLSSIFDQCRQFELCWVSFVTIKWTQGPSHRATRDIPCQLPTEANCRCDVSFARPLITSRPVSRSTHRAKENSDGKSLKSSTSLADVMKPETPEAQKGRTNYWWSFELGWSASDSPAFPYFLLLVQLKILNVDIKNGFQMALEAKRL